jgi:hypothetical protein
MANTPDSRKKNFEYSYLPWFWDPRKPHVDVPVITIEAEAAGWRTLDQAEVSAYVELLRQNTVLALYCPDCRRIWEYPSVREVKSPPGLLNSDGEAIEIWHLIERSGYESISIWCPAGHRLFDKLLAIA